MEHLRDGIGLRGYGQRDPKKEYKKEGYDLFVNMMAKVSGTVLVQVLRGAPPEEGRDRRGGAGSGASLPRRARARRRPPSGRGRRPRCRRSISSARHRTPLRRAFDGRPATAAPKIGRNDPCPCGSGTKFKKCHGAHPRGRGRRRFGRRRTAAARVTRRAGNSGRKGRQGAGQISALVPDACVSVRALTSAAVRR